MHGRLPSTVSELMRRTLRIEKSRNCAKMMVYLSLKIKRLIAPFTKKKDLRTSIELKLFGKAMPLSSSIK
jgi:hypothetical protein